MVHSKTSAVVLSENSSVNVRLCFVTALIAILVTASTAFGQAAKTDYKLIDIPNTFLMEEVNENASREQQRLTRDKNRQTKDRIRDFESRIQDFMRGKTNFAAVSDVFEPFLRRYVIAQMTDWKTPGALAKLGEMREDFLKSYLPEDAGRQQRQQLISTVVTIMREIVDETQDNGYHPAVRLNAVVLLGMLNDQEGDRGAGSFPTPSQSALQFLATVLTDQKYEPYLKVGAISGIKRHLQIESAAKRQIIDNATRNAIAAQTLALAKGTAPGQDTWDPSVSYWLKRRALQSLGLLGQPGANGEVIDLLVSQMNDEKSGYWLRFDCLVALGQLDLSKVNAQKLDGISYIIVEFVANSLEQEAVRIENDVEDLLIANVLYNDSNLLRTGTVKKDNRTDGLGSAAGGLAGDDEGGGGGESGGSADKDKKPKIELPVFYQNAARRRIKTIVYTAQGLLQKSENGSGIETYVSAKEKSFITQINRRLTTILSDADVGIRNLDLKEEEQEELDKNPKSYTQQMADICREAAEKLKAEVAKQKAPAAPPAGQPVPNEFGGGN